MNNPTVIPMFRAGYTGPGPALCKDCRHARPDTSPVFWFTRDRWSFAKCARLTAELSPVTGLRSRPSGSYCSVERMPGLETLQHHCGTKGKFFEPRQERTGWWSRFKRYVREGSAKS